MLKRADYYDTFSSILEITCGKLKVIYQKKTIGCHHLSKNGFGFKHKPILSKIGTKPNVPKFISFSLDHKKEGQSPTFLQRIAVFQFHNGENGNFMHEPHDGQNHNSQRPLSGASVSQQACSCIILHPLEQSERIEGLDENSVQPTFPVSNPDGFSSANPKSIDPSNLQLVRVSRFNNRENPNCRYELHDGQGQSTQRPFDANPTTSPVF